MSTDNYLRVNEIKNALYCPRIAYYSLVMQLDRETRLSQMGITAEHETKQKMKRRKYALHAVHDGIRHFDVPVVSHDLRLVGRIDEVLATDSGYYLVDYKDTDRQYPYWKIQMTAYRMALEEEGCTVLGCYAYAIPTQTYIPLKVTKREFSRLANVVTLLWDMVDHQVCPSATRHRKKCFSCQYTNFCNDVL